MTEILELADQEVSPEHIKLYATNINRVLDGIGQSSKPAIAAE